MLHNSGTEQTLSRHCVTPACKYQVYLYHGVIQRPQCHEIHKFERKFGIGLEAFEPVWMGSAKSSPDWTLDWTSHSVLAGALTLNWTLVRFKKVCVWTKVQNWTAAALDWNTCGFKFQMSPLTNLSHTGLLSVLGSTLLWCSVRMKRKRVQTPILKICLYWRGRCPSPTFEFLADQHHWHVNLNNIYFA